MTRQLSSILAPEKTYFLVGELEGVSSSLAMHLARQGAKHLAIMSRNSSNSLNAKNLPRKLQAMGCFLILLEGDAASVEDVKAVLQPDFRSYWRVDPSAYTFQSKHPFLRSIPSTVPLTVFRHGQ